MPGYRNWHLYPTRGASIARARKLAAGHLRGGRAVMYTFSSTSQSWAPGVTEVIKYNLGQIGLDVESRAFDFFFERAAARDDPWDIALIGWFADYPDPATFVNAFYASDNIHYGDFEQTLNWSRFRSRSVDRRLARAAALTGKARLEALARLDRDILLEAAPIAPLFTEDALLLVSPSVGCFTWSVYAHLNLVAVCKK
jgi:ABC-type oligopeptide transport system substrate-binding subunit